MLTREHVLLGKKRIDERTNQFKKNTVYGFELVLVSLPQPLHHTDDWIASFYIAVFKSRNYGNYVHVQYIRISYLVEIN